MTSNIEERSIVVTRVFQAPRELVFQAWTDPEHLVRWWGPKGFTLSVNKLEAKQGGEWRFTMHGPDGTDYPNRIVFDEVVPPERIVYTHGGDDEAASGQFQVTVTFVELADRKTELTMRMLFPSAADRDYVVKEHGAIQGANSTLDRLEELLAQL